MRVALYLRRSTNPELQADSHEIQEEQLRSYAVMHDHLVVRVYPDDASGRSANREGFQRLLRDVTTMPDFDAILVLDVSRWGRFANVDESAYWEFFCVSHGVRVLYVNEPFRHDTGSYDALLKAIKRVGAAEYSKEKSRSVQYAKARVVRQGFYPGGSAPYAMARYIMRPDAEPFLELAPGQRKVIGNYRVKLFPGDPAQVAIVRRIYAWYLAGVSRGRIARLLTSEGVPSPRTARRWYMGEVHKILRNPVYAGYARVHCSPSMNFPQGEDIVTPNAWPAIIEQATWDAVQRRLELGVQRRSPAGLAAQIKEAFERYGPLDPHHTVDLPAWGTYLRHFRDGTQEALCRAYETSIAAVRAPIIEELSRHFRVTHDGDCSVLNDLLVIKIVASFPRLWHRGINWEYRFHEDDPQDVTIGIGFSPPPQVAPLQLFLFRSAQIAPRALYPNLDGKTVENHYRRTLPEIITSLRYHFYRDARKARTTLLDALQGQSKINLSATARTLGWPAKTVHALYRSLVRDGHEFAPLEFQKRGRVTVPCAGCGVERRMLLWDALQLKTEYCQQCWQHRGKQCVIVTCPRCGKLRSYGASQLKRLTNGLETPCHACSACNIHARRARNHRMRRRALTRLMRLVCVLLRPRYPTIRLRPWVSALAPRLAWHEERRTVFLRLAISQAASLRLASQTEEEVRALAARVADRRRWRRAKQQRATIWQVRA